MGSSIKLNSQENQGTKFFFEIDFKIGIENKKEIVIEEENFDGIEGKILLAEDNPTNIILVQEILSKLSVELDCVIDGNEAVKNIKENNYDLVLMDVNMPNCDGISATKQIRLYEKENNKKEVPIIALTANVIKGDTQKFLECGMNEHLGKPIDFKELKKVLYKYLKS